MVENNKVRLIDANALKKATKGFTDCDGFNPVWQLIDNAPTVEPKKELVPVCKVTFDEEQLQEIVDKAKVEMLASIERPQGEWVGNAFDEHHCNRCGHPALWEEEPDNYYEVQSNFCPNCGAKMKGSAE